MLPDPLHPAVVHFPIVLMFILPVAALGALWAIRRGAPQRLAWAVPLLVAAALAGSSWVAVETGEQQEERAEDAVGERVLNTHEEAAERFLALSTVMLVITAAGFAGGTAGRVLRVTGAVAAVALIGAGYQVGHSGGRIVYGDATGPGLVAASGGEGGAAVESGEGAGEADGD
jgi:uncharacterized membrane protein